MANELDSDVAIIGGGPAGSATALALRRRGFSVLIVERSGYGSLRVGEILPPATKNILINLGLSSRLLNAEGLPSISIHSAWGQSDLYQNDHIFNPYGAGWHVERRHFDAELAHSAEKAGVSLHQGVRLVSCAPKEDGWKLGINCNSNCLEYRCKFLVDATGRASYVAFRQGAKRIIYDHLISVIGYFSPCSKRQLSNSYMLLESAENGWWYSAVLPSLELVVAYMTDADLYANGIRCSVTYIDDQLQQVPHTYSRVAAFVRDSDLKVLSASTYRMDIVAGINWLAVGDAATGVDPLSSQGVCKALKSGLQAAQSIGDYWEGDETALRTYSAWVKKSFDDYLILRKQYYSKERRWPNSSFWKRRQ